jgi:pectinesterase
MLRYHLFILSSCIALQSYPQSTAGITHKRDTSYTTYQAYLSTKKTHPDIKMVEELAPGTVIELKNIRYSFYGQDRHDTLFLDAFLPYPKKIEKSIAIIILHGGGWRTGDRSQHYPLAQRLAKLGYSCFTPQYRLSTEALYPAAVLDIKTAIQWLRLNSKNFNIDTNKIAVLGFSAGGELAAFMGATNGSLCLMMRNITRQIHQV